MIVRPLATCLVFAAVLAYGSARAADVTVTLVNNSNQAIVSAVAVKLGDQADAPANVLTADIAIGQEGTFVLQADEDFCTFDLTLAFSDGHTVTRKELDLCGSPRISVE